MGRSVVANLGNHFLRNPVPQNVLWVDLIHNVLMGCFAKTGGFPVCLNRISILDQPWTKCVGIWAALQDCLIVWRGKGAKDPRIVNALTLQQPIEIIQQW
jgi:hypothetical protein